MVGWLTALLIALIAVSTLSVREHANELDAPYPEGDTAFVNGVSPDFQTLLDVYSTSFYAYKKNGDLGNKTVSEKSQSQIQYSLDAMRDQINENQMYIQTFLDQYENSNPELEALHLKSQKLQQEGPEVANKLVTSAQDISRPIDYSGIMVRLVVLSMIVFVTFAISSF
jgi:hypothetical protein